MAKRTAIYKKDTLDRHLKLKDHSIFKRKQKESQNNIITEFAKQYDKEKDTIICQRKCIYFAAKNHISLDIYSKLCKLIMPQNQEIIISQVLALPKQLITNMNSACSSYGIYKNHNSGKEMEKS